MQPQMDPSWLEAVGDELETPAMQELRAFLAAEIAAGRGFYPPAPLVFNALRLTPLDAVRVVILGQDPYHGRGQAMGLSLLRAGGRHAAAVAAQHLRRARHRPRPARARRRATSRPGPSAACCCSTACSPSRPGSPASHAGKGWETFTDRVIAELSARREGIVFLLWGRYAQQKGAIVDTARHHVLTAAHPSPYSASNGFFGCRHFSRANALLEGGGPTAGGLAARRG